MCTWLSDLTSAAKIPNVIKTERQIAHCDDRSADEVWVLLSDHFVYRWGHENQLNRPVHRKPCSSAFSSVSLPCWRTVYRACCSSLLTNIIPVSSDSKVPAHLKNLSFKLKQLSIVVSDQLETLKMKAFTVSSLAALLAAVAQAAPAPAQIDSREPRDRVTFEGADPDAFYTQYVPISGSFKISTLLRHVHVFLVSIILINPPLPHASDVCRTGLVESRWPSS